jgi:hypothetical protein
MLTIIKMLMEGDFKSCVGCILCYNNDVNVHNLRIEKRKGLIKYYKTYGITSLRKHVDAN